MRAWIARWLGGYRSVLAKRDVKLLFGGLVTSDIGTWAYSVALLAFVFDRTHSLGWVGVASVVRFVPPLVLSTYGGVLADRYERIRLMVCSDLVCALWQGGLAVVAATGGSPVLGLVLAALTAASSVVYEPAVAATIPSLVEADDLTAANALNSTVGELAVIVGPAVGAGLLVLGSPSAVFAVNAASFLVSAGVVSRIRTRSKPVDVTQGGTAGPLAQMAVGVRTILRLPAARTLVAYSVLVTFVYGTDTVLFIGVSQHKLGTGSQGWGYLMAGIGVGGVLAAGAVNRLAGSRRLAAIILAGALGYCLPTALLIVVHSPALAFVIQVFRGSSTLVVDVLAVTALQRAVPADELARVFGVFYAFILGAMALGAVVTPPVVSALGLDGGLWVMSLGPSVLAIAGYPALVAIDRQTSNRARELEPKVALLSQLEMFAVATRPILERLAEAATEVTFDSGKAIVQEGEPADALYVLAEGEVEVSARGEGGGPDRKIRVMTAPSYFGEIGVLEGIPRTATVRASAACRCERIDGDTLLDVLLASPPSSALLETTRGRLAVTHPARRATFGAPAQDQIAAQ